MEEIGTRSSTIARLTFALPPPAALALLSMLLLVSFTSGAAAQDSDEDGLPAWEDVDIDGDGIPNVLEGGNDRFMREGFETIGSASLAIPGTGPGGNGSEYEITLADKPDQLGGIGSKLRIDVREDFKLELALGLGRADTDAGGDGMAIVLHAETRRGALAAMSGQVTGTFGALGIGSGIAIEFDTYQNTDIPLLQDLPEDHTAIWDTDSAGENDQGYDFLLGSTVLGDGQVENGGFHDVTLEWKAETTTLSYTFDSTPAGSVTEDLRSTRFADSDFVHLAIFGQNDKATNDHYVGLFNFDGTLVDAEGNPVPSAEEAGIDGDADDDGNADFDDIDSDGDTVTDAFESGFGLAFDENGRVPGPVGANGLVDALESSLDSGLVDLDGDGRADPLLDTDGDGTPDVFDFDSDNDGIDDVAEAGSGPDSGNAASLGEILDTDGDGIVDMRDLDSDGDGLSDTLESQGLVADRTNDGILDGFEDTNGNGRDDGLDAVPLELDDVDADELPAHLDTDTDGDGLDDAQEAGQPWAAANLQSGDPIDANGDGLADVLASNASLDSLPDLDADGVPDIAQTGITTEPAMASDDDPNGDPASGTEGGKVTNSSGSGSGCSVSTVTHNGAAFDPTLILLFLAAMVSLFCRLSHRRIVELKN